MYYNYPEEFLFQVIEKENLDIISPLNSREIIDESEFIVNNQGKILKDIDEEYIKSLDNNLILE